MRKIILCLIMILVFAGFVEASVVNRSFSSNNIGINETITVSLDIIIDDGASFYIIDEVFPVNWTITDPGSGDTSQAGHIKWVVITGATNTTYTYNISSPLIEGLYEFTGEYIFEFMSGNENISGEKLINVGGGGDTTPPVISNVVNSSITNESVIISWDTDEPADSLLEYGTGFGLGMNVADGSFVTSHMVSLGNLSGNTTYYYNITSCDNNSNCNTSGVYSFTTLADSEYVINQSDNSIENEYGKIRFNNATNFDNASLCILMMENFISVDSSTCPEFDKDAIVSIYGLSFDEIPVVYKDNVLCSDCVFISYINGNLSFNVSGFSNYAAGANSQLGVWDDTDFGGKLINESVGFYANYTNSSSGLGISDASCEIKFDIGLGWDGNASMSYNASSGLFEYYRNFSSGGSFIFNVLCNRSGYETLNVSDGFVITGDTNPPLISNVRAESVGSNSATILWDSDENANSTVYYGNSTSLGERAGSNLLVINHSVGLSGLDSNTTYYYKAGSCDSDGNCANSSVYNFTTLVGVSDDLEVNYVRGQIRFDGGYAPAGTLFWVNVTSGPNSGFVYNGSVDDGKIPGFLLGEGRYDTGDNVEFNTGDSFILSAENCNNAVNDVFAGGGNIIDLNCANQAPSVNIPDVNVSEDTNPGLIDLWQYVSDDADADENLSFELLSESNASLIDCSLISNRYINCSDPAANKFGVSALVVNVTDTGNLSANDSFNINVLSVNDAPVIGVMDQNMNEDASILVNLSLYASDVEGDALSYYIIQQNVSEVSCVVNGEMLNITPAADWWGNGTCSVIANDGQDNSTEDTFNIFVTNVADAPIFNGSIIPDSSGMIIWPEDTNYSIDLSPYFIDIDGLGLSYNAIGNTNVNVVFNGSIATLVPAVDWFGIDYVVFNASNSAGSAVSNNVTLNVTPVNDAPSITVPDQNMNEDASILVNLSLYASDVEGDALTFRATQQNISEVSCVVNGEMLNITPAADWWGNGSCSVVANDGQENSTEDTFNIFVTNVADAPQFNGSNPVPDQTWDEDTVNVLDLALYVIDIDGIGITYSVIGNSNIAISFVGSVATMTPALNWNGVETVVFNVSNAAGSSLSNDVTLTVNPVNDAPIISNVSDITVTEGDLVSVSPVVTDAENDSVAVSFSSPLNSSGEWQTDFSDAGVYNAVVSADDGNGGISNVSFTITVNEFGNHDPVITILTPNITVTEGEIVQVMVNATDLDQDTLTFIYDAPLNSTGGWQTDYTDSGIYNISVAVTDGNGGSDIGYVLVTVLESGNHAPVLDPISDISVTEGEVAEINPSASDPDGDNLTFIFTAPLNSSGEWQTSYSNAGSYQTLVTVTDGALNDSQYVTINVLESGNHDPVLDYINDITVTEGDIVQINPSGSDPDNDTLYFTFTSPLNSTGGWQTGFTDSGVHVVTVTANDGNGGTDSQNVTITVNEFGNHNPVLDLIDNVTVVEGELVDIDPSASDVDGDDLIFIFDSPLDSYGEWQTDFSDAGFYATVVRVEDGNGGADSQFVYIEVLESGNHAPVLSNIGDITAVVCDTVVIEPVVSDPDDDPVTVTISEPVGNDGIWDSCGYEPGEYKVIVSASDGDLITSQEVIITLMNKPKPHTNIDSLKILNEYIKPGEDLEISLKLGNDGRKDLKRARVTAVVQELGLRAQLKSFDIKVGKAVNKKLLLHIPYDAPAGRYELRITISNDESRRVKYREFIVI